MKRSEMLAKTRIVIQMTTSGLSLEQCENIADNVLHQLEKAGMLPPEYTRVCENEFQYNSYKLNQWEPEDE